MRRVVSATVNSGESIDAGSRHHLHRLHHQECLPFEVSNYKRSLTYIIMIYDSIMRSLLILLLSSPLTAGFLYHLSTSVSACKSLYSNRVTRHSECLFYRRSGKNHKARQNELLMVKGDSDTNPFYRGQDAYQILEVPRGADKKVIKSSYRKAVSTWHPDKFPDDDKKKAEGNLRMEKINRAWYCLGDDDRKRRYDQFGEQGVGSSASSEEQIKAAGSPMSSGGFGGGQGSGAVDVNDISDIFDAFFGGSEGGRAGGGFGRGQQQRQKPRNMNVPVAGTTFLNISFFSSNNVVKNAAFGCYKCRIY